MKSIQNSVVPKFPYYLKGTADPEVYAFGFKYLKSVKVHQDNMAFKMCTDSKNGLLYCANTNTGLIKVFNLMNMEEIYSFGDDSTEDIQLISIVFSVFDSTLVVSYRLPNKESVIVKKLDKTNGQIIWSLQTSNFLLGMTINTEDGTIYGFKKGEMQIVSAQGLVIEESVRTEGKMDWNEISPYYCNKRIIVGENNSYMHYLSLNTPTGIVCFNFAYDVPLENHLCHGNNHTSLTIDEEKRLGFLTYGGPLGVLVIFDLYGRKDDCVILQFFIPFFNYKECRMVTNTKNSQLIISDKAGYLHFIEYGHYEKSLDTQYRKEFYELAREREFFNQVEIEELNREIPRIENWVSEYTTDIRKKDFTKRISKLEYEVFAFGEPKTIKPYSQQEKDECTGVLSERNMKFKQIADLKLQHGIDY